MATAHTPASLNIHDVRLLNLSLEEAVCAIEAAVVTGEPTRVAFVNADCVNIAARDPAYRRALADMDWVFADGIGMRIAGRILGQPVRANVNGTDLFPRLCQTLARQGRRLYLLGARPGIAEAAGQWAVQHNHGLQLAGVHHGYFKEEDTGKVLQDIRDSQADVLLVALGAPRQEHWIQEHMNACGATVVVAVGGLFDYYSGRIPRAPRWVRRCGLEWTFRLLQEPSRLWKRYLLGNPVFLARTGRALLRQNQHTNERTSRTNRRSS